MNDYQEITRDTYNKIAATVGDTYDDYFYACVKPEADHFLNSLSEKSKILDIGCGVGTHMEYFLSKGHSPFGIDISSSMVSLCKKKDLNVEEFDIQHFLESNSILYDAIWAHTSLIHFPKCEWNNLLNDIANTLSSSGKLFIAVREGESEGYEEYKEDEGLKRWFSNFVEGEIEKFLPQSLIIESETKTVFRGRGFLNVHIHKV